MRPERKNNITQERRSSNGKARGESEQHHLCVQEHRLTRSAVSDASKELASTGQSLWAWASWTVVETVAGSTSCEVLLAVSRHVDAQLVTPVAFFFARSSSGHSDGLPNRTILEVMLRRHKREARECL